MAKIASLSRARKNKDRMKKRAQADENALKFGLSKSEKQLQAARRAKVVRDLDGHERDT